MPRGGTAPACDEKPWGGGLGTSYNIYDSIKIYGTSAANQNINAYSKWKPQTDLIQPKPRKKAPLSLGEGFGRCSVGSPADKGQRNSIFKAYGVKKRGPIKAKLMPPEEAALPSRWHGPPNLQSVAPSKWLFSTQSTPSLKRAPSRNQRTCKSPVAGSSQQAATSDAARRKTELKCHSKCRFRPLRSCSSTESTPTPNSSALPAEAGSSLKRLAKK